MQTQPKVVSIGDWSSICPIEALTETLRYALFAEEKQAELQVLHEAGFDTAALIAMQYLARAQDYGRRFPQADDRLLSSRCGEPAGRLLVNRADGQWHLIDLCVLARFRRTGIATRALEELCSDAKDAQATIELSVLRLNPALHLYQQLGFQVVDSTSPVSFRMRCE